MLDIIAVSDGSYNVFGLEGGAFYLQGNLTLDQLKDLARLSKKVVEAEKSGRKIKRTHTA